MKFILRVASLLVVVISLSGAVTIGRIVDMRQQQGIDFFFSMAGVLSCIVVGLSSFIWWLGTLMTDDEGGGDIGP